MIYSFLRQIDLFGALYKPRLVSQDPFHQTAIGGIATIIIYGLCLSYLIFGLIQWQNDAFLPKVTSSQELLAELEYQRTGELFTLQMSQQIHSNVSSKINPFSRENNIFYPMIVYVENNQIVSFTPYYQDDDSDKLVIQNISLYLNAENGKSKEVIIGLAKCLENCASDELIQQFFAQKQNGITLSVPLVQFNVKLRKYETIIRQLDIALSQYQSYYGQLIVQITKSSINSGVFVDSIETDTKLNNFELIGQTIDLAYLENSVGRTIYFQLFIKLNTLQTTQNIEFPKFGEVLATVGSIIQTVLLLKYLFLKINERVGEIAILDKIVSFYYPDFKNFQIQRGPYGIVMKIREKGEIINKQEFMAIYNKLLDKARNKLTIQNQLYEISRLQFLIQKKLNLSHHDLSDSKKLGIPWPNKEELEMDNIDQSSHIFQNDDFDALAYDGFQDQQVGLVFS